MKISKFVKSMTYLTLSAVLLILSVVFQRNLHSSNSNGAFIAALMFLFFSGCSFVGTALYSFKAYTKKHEEHRFDSLFLFICGMPVLIYAVVAVINYGAFDDEIYKISGANITNATTIVMSLVFVPTTVRGVYLGFFRDNGDGEKRKVMFFLIGIVVVFIVGIFLGGMMKMKRNTKAGETDLFSQHENSETST